MNATASIVAENWSASARAPLRPTPQIAKKQSLQQGVARRLMSRTK